QEEEEEEEIRGTWRGHPSGIATERLLATAAPPAATAAAATTASNVVSLVAAAAAIFMCSFGGRNEARYHPHVNPYIFIEIRTRKDTIRRRTSLRPDRTNYTAAAAKLEQQRRRKDQR
ncbi:hypothetical protein V1477_018036, partial [Vespula maculifrons]